jgi:UDP-N-acetylmuramoyl-tripeptide--D-alanyl-D-alanine ligase
MVDAILTHTGRAITSQTLVVLSPGPDAAGNSLDDAISRLDDDWNAVVTADWGPPAIPAIVTGNVTTFGLSAGADLHASDLSATIDGTSFTLTAHGESRRVHLQLLGEHQVTNALAAIGIASSCGASVDDSVAALERLTTVGSGRMEVLRRADGVVVINDAISASPQAMAAALKTLALVVGGRRSVAVLGELSVPAEDAAAEHDRIGRLIVRLNVKKLIVVGHDARHIHNAAGLEGSWDGESVLVDTDQEAYDLLRDELREQDVVLVKSSKQAGLGALAIRLAGASS